MIKCRRKNLSQPEIFVNVRNSISNIIPRLIKDNDSFKTFNYTKEKLSINNNKEIYVKAKVTRNGKQCKIYIQRNFLGKLVSIFTITKQ